MKIRIGQQNIPFFTILSLAFVVYFYSAQSVFALESDLNKNSIPDHTEASVTMTQSSSLPAGEYNFNNLIISNKSILTLEGDQNSPNPFKGVKINAVNLNVNAGSAISANAQGYVDGPGTPASDSTNSGASYGGKGYGSGSAPTYGDNIEPTDLGSGSYSNMRGGGAIWLVVSNDLVNNGAVSANGAKTSSGGSVYARTKNLKGNGAFRANGGDSISCLNSTNCSIGPGGGGRIAIYFENKSFVGITEASVNVGAEKGTIGWFDILNNNLEITNTNWIFNKKHSPYLFNNIYITKSEVYSEDNISISTQILSFKDQGKFHFGKDQVLNANSILVSNSYLFLSGTELINSENLDLSNDATIWVRSEKVLYLNISNITLQGSSFIDADNNGPITGPGSPPIDSSIGASHGGLGTNAQSYSLYGSQSQPSSFGSGKINNNTLKNGGGVIRIISDYLVNNGYIGAGGASGGSIYITAKNLSGNGNFNADGGNSRYGCPDSCEGSGGGGRIAIYYENSTFTGTISAKGGSACDASSCTKDAQDGTVVFKQTKPSCGELCNSNIMFFPGIMGSRLYRAPTTGEEQNWVSLIDSLQEKLSLNPNGKSKYSIYTKNDTKADPSGIVDNMLETGIVDVAGGDIYNSFINDLQKWQEEGTIQDYEFIPYDWRLALEDVVVKGGFGSNGRLFYNKEQDFSQSFIFKKLKALQSSSRTGKVTLVGHSNGGLVIKALIQKLKDTNNPLYDKIDQVIFVGVPQVGTPQTLVNLLHGQSMGGGFLMSAKRNRQLAENMPSAYNLIPSGNYFSTIISNLATDQLISFENKPFFKPQIDQYGISITNGTELKNFILGTDGRAKPAFNDTDNPNIGNSTLYPQSETVHQILDSWQPSINTKVVQTAGWGEETISSLRYQSYINVSGIEKLKKKINVNIEGDETVMVPSALWMSNTNPNTEKWWIDLKKEGGVFSNDRTHKDLLEISNLRNFIKSKVTGVSFFDPEGIVVNNQPTTTFAPRIHYQLFTDGTVGIADAKGRYTGIDVITGKLRQEIPNVKYMEIGNTKFISVPEGLIYTLKIDAKEDVVMDVDRQVGNYIKDSNTIISKFNKGKIFTMDAGANLDLKSLKLKEVLRDSIKTEE